MVFHHKPRERTVETKSILDENRRLHAENRSYQENLEELVRQRTAELGDALEGTIRAMALAVESRDPYTAGHEQRVARLARAIAEEMRRPEEEVLGTYHAGLVHDVGKISVPAEILTYPGKHGKEELGIIRKHPRTGRDANTFAILRRFPSCAGARNMTMKTILIIDDEPEFIRDVRRDRESADHEGKAQ